MRFWSDKITPFSETRSLQCGNKILSLGQPAVMGILNLTPDSFYDGSRYQTPDEARRHAGMLIAEGASVIDLGAVSTRPGAEDVSLTEERSRLIPVLKALAKEFPETIFSVDTYRAEIVEEAFDSGAGIINDISGGRFDKQMLTAVGRTRLPYVLMHMLGTPASMQQQPVYADVVKEVRQFFEMKLEQLYASGIEQIILDPGFGFGKTADHNFSLLRHLDVFTASGYPVLTGISRKSMIYKPLGITPAEALNGTTALHFAALLSGTHILRVHDVKEAVQAIKLATLYRGESE
jgi:dihydropteroate synthase